MGINLRRLNFDSYSVVTRTGAPVRGMPNGDGAFGRVIYLVPAPVRLFGTRFGRSIELGRVILDFSHDGDSARETPAASWELNPIARSKLNITFQYPAEDFGTMHHMFATDGPWGGFLQYLTGSTEASVPVGLTLFTLSEPFGEIEEIGADEED